MKKLVALICLITAGFSAQPKDYVITKHGVKADSTILNTQAIQKVIDKAHAKGGGTIVIPKGVFLSGALFFKPNTKLRLMEGATLKGSDNIANYPLIPSRMEGQSLPYYAALVNAYNVDKFSIAGPGVIDGNGLKFWRKFWSHRDSVSKLGKQSTNLEVHRPRLIFLWGSNNVIIRNVKLRNSGFWTTHLYQCNDVLIENTEIRSPARPVPAPSTDGIDIDVCKRVTIRNCYIAVNDDAIVLKGGKGPDAHKKPENGPVEDILIENCTFGPSHSTLTIGSESIHARNVIMRNCKVENNCPILKFKMRPDTYQTIENILVENITGTAGTIIDISPWRQFFDMKGSTEKPFGTIRNITMSNIDVKCQRFGNLQGNVMDTFSNVLFKDIKATAASGVVKNTNPAIKFENVVINGSALVAN